MGEGPERRDDDKSLHVLIGMVRSLTQNVTNYGEQVLELNQKLNRLLSAFPEGKDGVDGFTTHRLYHTKRINSDREAEDFKRSLIKSLSILGIGGTLTMVAAALLLYAQVKLGSGKG